MAVMRLRLKPLRDQVIVITGASSGIGLATASALLEHSLYTHARLEGGAATKFIVLGLAALGVAALARLGAHREAKRLE